MILKAPIKFLLRDVDVDRVKELDLVGIPFKNSDGYVIGKVQSVDYENGFVYLHVDHGYLDPIDNQPCSMEVKGAEK